MKYNLALHGRCCYNLVCTKEKWLLIDKIYRGLQFHAKLDSFDMVLLFKTMLEDDSDLVWEEDRCDVDIDFTEKKIKVAYSSFFSFFEKEEFTFNEFLEYVKENPKRLKLRKEDRGF